jgi:hypothetical protein
MQPLVCLIISVLLTAELNGVDAVHCNREPEDTHTPKSVGNHFQIRISGNPDKYVPGGIYTGKVLTPAFMVSVRVLQNTAALCTVLYCTVLYSKSCPNQGLTWFSSVHACRC